MDIQYRKNGSVKNCLIKSFKYQFLGEQAE